MIGFGQLTYVPDDNFEAYLEANGMGNGNSNDDYVNNGNINTVTTLDVSNQNISDLTGIEDFAALAELYFSNNQVTSIDLSANLSLAELWCEDNQLTSLDASANTVLGYLECSNNQLTSLNVSNNLWLKNLFCDYNQLTSLNLLSLPLLEGLSCSFNQLSVLDLSENWDLDFIRCDSNQLTSLDVSEKPLIYSLWCEFNQITTLDLSQNLNLEILRCSSNQLTSLNVSDNTDLIQLHCNNNQLNSLDIRNGNNVNISTNSLATDFSNNPNLYCINVDDASWSTTNWTVANGNIDQQHYFSNNCSTTAIEEHTTNKELLKVTDLLGRETKQTNQPLFYIYDDGTVEKKIVIE